VVGLEIVGENSIDTVKAICGPENPYNAKNEKPGSLRATFGKDPIKNAVHCSENAKASEHERSLFFGSAARVDCASAILSNCSLCLIKPHAFQDGKAGKIIDKILEDGFEISAMQTVFLDRAEAEEFFELYKGIHPAFHQMIDQCVCGPLIAIEVRQENVVQAFKRLCGPHDAEKAKAQSPQSIRALYGHDKVMNAVHCTDLESDAQLEVEFFFVILESRSRNE
jgi:nucleoside-diphosphate kinase